MQTNESTIKLLQQLLSAVLAGAQMHYLHAQINRQQGFTKLADRMLEEYQEEMASVADFLQHIDRLGGSVEVTPESFTIYHDVHQQLLAEYTAQHEGVQGLERLIASSELDLVTDNFLQAYLDDEVEHEAWLKKQVGLIEQIGIANYLATQI